MTTMRTVIEFPLDEVNERSPELYSLMKNEGWQFESKKEDGNCCRFVFRREFSSSTWSVIYLEGLVEKRRSGFNTKRSAREWFIGILAAVGNDKIFETISLVRYEYGSDCIGRFGKIVSFIEDVPLEEKSDGIFDLGARSENFSSNSIEFDLNLIRQRNEGTVFFREILGEFPLPRDSDDPVRRAIAASSYDSAIWRRRWGQ